MENNSSVSKVKSQIQAGLKKKSMCVMIIILEVSKWGRDLFSSSK